MYSYKLFGADASYCQLPLIRRGFQELENWKESFDTKTDLVYSNDAGYYNQAINYKKQFGGQLVLNVLDIPIRHIINYDLNGLKTQLLQADQITCISKTTQNDIKYFLDLDSIVIYNPSQIVYEVPGLYNKNEQLKFLHVGRRSDPNKRYHIITSLIQNFYDENQLLNIGPDYGIGKITGLIDSKYLISYYNHSDYVLIGTFEGGIELPGIEAILCGKKVIAPRDCECCTEFFPDFLAEPTAQGFYNKIQEIESNPEKYSAIIKEYQIKYSKQFFYQTIVDNIMEVYNNYKK